MAKQLECEERLKTILISDKKQNPKKIVKIIKSEVFYILKNYFDLNIENFNVNIDVDDKKRYVVSINFESNNIKMANTL